MIHKLYEEAGRLHGHYCPGLAIGVRAAFEALRILDVKEKAFNLYCIAESRACYMDGIQMIFGTTLGNGNIEVRDRGKTAFNFYDRSTGRSVRLYAVKRPAMDDRQQMAEFILSAPVEQVFAVSEVHFEAPEDTYVQTKKLTCPLCGEECDESHMKRSGDGLVCSDCAEA